MDGHDAARERRQSYRGREKGQATLPLSAMAETQFFRGFYSLSRSISSGYTPWLTRFCLGVYQGLWPLPTHYFFWCQFCSRIRWILKPYFVPQLQRILVVAAAAIAKLSRSNYVTPIKIDCGSSGALSPQDLNLFAFNSRILISRIHIYSPDSFAICCGFGSRDLEHRWIWFLHAAALPVLVSTGADCHSSHVC